MNLSKIKKGFQIVSKVASQHSPTILTVIGVGLMIGGVVVTIIEAPKAKEELDILEEDDELSHKEYLKEKAHIIALHYWKTASITLGGAGLIFWGHKISLGRTAAALAAYSISEDKLKKLEDKIIEMDGEKHLQKAKDEINKERILNTPPTNEERIIHTGKGELLFMDSITGQKFRSSYEAVRRAINSLNADMLSSIDMTVSLNAWLGYLGCDSVDIGEKLGWRFEKVGDNIGIDFTVVDKPNEEVYNLIVYDVTPIWDYNVY